MKLEAIIVCVNYSDFLAWTLPFSRQQFDNIIIITDKNDAKTQALCEYWHIKCIRTEINKDEGFPKGKLINIGLENLIYNDWVVHQDADLYLPPHFRRLFENITKDAQSIYTMDRMMCQSYKEWIQFLESPQVQWENNIWIHSGPFKAGVRIAQMEKDGCVPIGYFQCWNQGVMNLMYPTEHTSAARGDMQFGMQFPRNKRQFLNECIAIHLESPLSNGKIEMGQNWNGRTSEEFSINTLNTNSNASPQEQ